MTATEVDEESLAPGTLIAGRYRVGERLGAGAMGAVYYAEHVTVQRPVAIKVLAPQWLGHREMVERFRSEARSASAAGHPNIIEVFDAGDLESGVPYLVMEYLPGRELFDLVREADGMAPARAARYGRAVARAIAAAHERGIVHRDLKAENVMVVERGGEEMVKVLDFGVAHVASGDGRRTAPGMVIGTPEYMAPEQVRGKPATPAIDVYALGVLLHEMLAGRPPFRAAEPIDVLAMKTAGPAPPLAQTRPGLPSVLTELVDACLATDPEGRPTAHEVARRLDEFLDEPGAVTEAVEPSRPPWGWALAIAAVAAAATATLVLVLRDDPAPDPTPPVAAAPAVSAEPAAPAVAASTTGPPAVAASSGEADESAGSSSGGAEEVAPAPATGTSSDPPRAPTKTDVGPRTLPPPPAGDRVPDPDPDSAACRRTRTRAHEARQTQDWAGLLRYTNDAGCWPSQLERRRLRVYAMLQSGKYDRCIALGRGSSDAEIAKSVALCERKKGG